MDRAHLAAIIFASVCATHGVTHLNEGYDVDADIDFAWDTAGEFVNRQKDEDAKNPTSVPPAPTPAAAPAKTLD